MEDPEATYIGSEAQKAILLDVFEVYLAHVYDRQVLAEMLKAVVGEDFNLMCHQNDLCQVDVTEFVDFALTNTREHTIGEQSFFFGRSKPVKRGTTSELAAIGDQANNDSFVNTSTTLRLMEQIRVALQMNESLLLVGETGTGKTTIV